MDVFPEAQWAALPLIWTCIYTVEMSSNLIIKGWEKWCQISEWYLVWDFAWFLLLHVFTFLSLWMFPFTQYCFVDLGMVFCTQGFLSALCIGIKTKRIWWIVEKGQIPSVLLPCFSLADSPWPSLSSTRQMTRKHTSFSALVYFFSPHRMDFCDNNIKSHPLAWLLLLRS